LAQQHKFNDDLLIGDADRQFAGIKFPRLFELMDFPELREVFAAHDAPANRLKKKRRRSGIGAIILGAAALAAAASSPIVPEQWLTAVGCLASGCGVLSILVGGLGVVSGKSLDAWLHHRLITERLRQLHFQILVFRMPAAIKAMDDKAARDRYLELRRADLASFALSYEGHETSMLRAVLDDADESEFQLVATNKQNPEGNVERLAEFLDAYRLLRFGHQIQYADWMLRRDRSLLPSSASGQFRLLRAIALCAMVGIFFVHLVLAIKLAATALPGDHWIDVLIMWLAILMMVSRAFEEGVQPGRELERYSTYRATLRRLQRLFEATDDLSEKHRLMVETERTVYQEMRAFLLLHEDARFVL
jgi:hypothetical protein